MTWTSFPTLNVTAPFIGKGGIKLSIQGESVEYFGTLTGAVTSPNVYQIAETEVNLLKPQALANLYKQQMELNALLGDCTVRGDAVALGPYQLVNCSIKSIRPLDFSGEHAEFTVIIGGYYLVNSSLFN